MDGTVKFFDDAKGYGFIRRDDGEGDVFVHFSEIVGGGHRTLNEGEEVDFEIGEGRQGPQAVKVRVKANMVRPDEVELLSWDLGQTTRLGFDLRASKGGLIVFDDESVARALAPRGVLAAPVAIATTEQIEDWLVELGGRAVA